DHLRRGTIDFSQVRHLVLDEADEMLSMGFEKELSQIIEGLPPRRQNLLFSATIPDDIRRLAGRYMSDATIVSVSGDAVAAAEISHYVYLVSGIERMRDLVRVFEVERPVSALVFCNTKDETQAVARYLREAGYDADWINSDLSQSDRERVMAATRKGELKFLVATDVAARGIDISHLSHVINFSFPESVEIYVHRTGRTGRQGRPGAAVSLITPHDIGNLYFLRLTYKIFPVERQLPTRSNEARGRELALLDDLRRRVAGADCEVHRGLARRVLQSIDAEQLVVGLLASWFGQPEEPPAGGQEDRDAAGPSRRSRRRRGRGRPEDGAFAGAGEPVAPMVQPEPEPEPESAPEPEPEPAPEPEPEPEARPKPDTAKARDTEAEQQAVREREVAASRIAHPADEQDGRLREIYLDAGRKDGLRISTLMKEIVDRSGLPRTAIGRVRMLTRATFVAVPEDSFEAVLRVLCELQVDGRRLIAEPAEDA
ncbi:MAG TPA: DEAD/DEAH box helicase, partial [Polyangia bacterium]|nr:DEAD/DEAH box helicase [Polyangia bacterium]